MKHLLFIPLFFLLVTIGCSNDDDSNASPAVSQIDGKWNLINVTGGFAGVNQDFEKGTIIWDFNDVTKMVTITNNATITGVYTGLDSGTYPYAIHLSFDNDIPTLIVNENSLGTLSFTTPLTVMIDDQLTDGFKLTFER